MFTGLALGEALLLGLASGPACVASCGPVVVPSLLVERPGLRLNIRYLLAFLGSRLVGYLLFAVLAWQLGSLALLKSSASSLVFGIVHIGLAVVLLRYAYSVGKLCEKAETGPQLVTIGSHQKGRIPGAAVLGLLTGLSLCPPFLAAGVRAAHAANVVTALLFFAVFFVGTTIWFVPFAGMGWIRRNEAVTTVARMAMVLIALYYLLVGIWTLLGRNAHAY